jgi:mitogen-activated protein kinase kinase
MAGTFTGTSYYMAPERIRGLPYNITSDVWSLGLTILEVASNRFPFPPEGEPALGPIELLSYIVSMKTPELKDDQASGVKWTKAFKDFLDNCLEKDGTKRYGPVKMLNHPFMKKSMSRVPQPNLAKFVAEVWGWTYEENCNDRKNPPTRTAPTEDTPLENVDVPGIGRVASLRIAPSPNVNPRALKKLQVSREGPALKGVDEGTSSSDKELDSGGRTAAERALAKKREADVGLIGSPTVELDLS